MIDVLRRGLVVLGICLLTTATSAGQSGAPGRVAAELNVQVEILGSLSVIAEKGVRFGEVRPGDGRVFVPRENDRAGMFVVRGREGMPVTVSFRGPQGGRLQRFEGDGWMQVSAELYGSDVNSAAVADPLQLGETITLGEEGTYYFFLQAALEVMEENQNPPGEYSGTFTLEVEYQ